MQNARMARAVASTAHTKLVSTINGAIQFVLVDRRYSQDELVAAGFEPDFVTRVAEMIRRNHYKRRLPIIAKLSHRTVDRDFRYARDWGT